VPDTAILELRRLFTAAFDEVHAAILDEFAKGRTPERDREAEYSLQENGLPRMSDASYSTKNGVLKPSSLLEPAWGDDAARAKGAYPSDRFPALHQLYALAASAPPTVPGFGEGTPEPLQEIYVRFQVAGAADIHILRHGQVGSTPQSRAAVLTPLLKRLVEPSLPIAIAVPIAMVRFDFDRLRLAPNAFVLRMSPALQKARWSGKSYAASGHDGVLAAATHAFVLTGWSIPNDDYIGLARTLSERTESAREAIDALFAALRLETGLETGYAQEIRLARGWRTDHHLGRPEVFAVGARRYPEAFDHWGWTRDEVPLVSRDQMRRVGALHVASTRDKGERFDLALRRLNAAMTRDDTADAILDATIGLEILLGDSDGQAISWKLRMRAAALASLSGEQDSIEATREAMTRIYEVRSAIVHGLTGRKRNITPGDAAAARLLATSQLRAVLKTLIEQPRFRDPLVIDRELMLGLP
jgi:hypothetical protein